MSKPHKCPVCKGTGLVSRPPGVAGDNDFYTVVSDNPGPFTCKACLGKCIIWEQDPVYVPSCCPINKNDIPDSGTIYYGDPPNSGVPYTITTLDNTTFQEEEIIDGFATEKS